MFTKKLTGWPDGTPWVKENGLYRPTSTVATKKDNVWVKEKDKDVYALIVGLFGPTGQVLRTVQTSGFIDFLATEVDVFQVNTDKTETFVKTIAVPNSRNTFSLSGLPVPGLLKFKDFRFAPTSTSILQQTMIFSDRVTDIVHFGSKFKALGYPYLAENAVSTLPILQPPPSVRGLRGAFSRTFIPASVSLIDVSLITDFTNCFKFCKSNFNLSNWNTANATTMASMFMQSSFNSDISMWNVDKVTYWTGFRDSGSALSTANTPLKFR